MIKLSNELEDEASDIEAKAKIGAAETGVDWQTLLNQRALRAVADGEYLPSVLRETRADALQDFEAKSISAYGMLVNNYLLTDSEKGEALIVDASGDYFLKYLSDKDLQLSKILITHEHADHVCALGNLTKKFPHAELISPEKLKDGEEIEFGGAKAHIMVTPGHCEKHFCFYFEDWRGAKVCFVGDLIFAASIGRPNFSFKASMSSVRDKILRLPEDCLIFSGHGCYSSVADEKAGNPFFT